MSSLSRIWITLAVCVFITKDPGPAKISQQTQPQKQSILELHAQYEQKLRSTVKEKKKLEGLLQDIELDNFRVQVQVVGGSGAQEGTFPWQVAIRPKGELYAVCGGTIIATEWVMTAAHCFSYSNTNSEEKVEIYAGSVTLSMSPEHIVGVKKIIIAPGWSKGSPYRDVALVQLAKQMDSAAVAALINSADDESNLIKPPKKGVVSGWGYLTEDRGPATALEYVPLNFVTRSTCNDPASYAGIVNEEMICAGERDRAACFGDSGGPLIVPENTPPNIQTMRVVGIVGSAVGCGREYKYGIYARVLSYVPWIECVEKNPEVPTRDHCSILIAPD